jgi:hypothetical protein
MRVIAVIEEPPAIEKILRRLGLPHVPLPTAPVLPRKNGARVCIGVAEMLEPFADAEVSDVRAVVARAVVDTWTPEGDSF